MATTNIEKVTDEEFLSTLDALVREHPDEYPNGYNTPHKEATSLDYSYDDCVVGRMCERLAPEVREKMLDYEKEWQHSFSIEFLQDRYRRSNSDPAQTRDKIADALAERFTPAQRDVLENMQAEQDSGERWDILPAIARVRLLPPADTDEAAE